MIRAALLRHRLRRERRQEADIRRVFAALRPGRHYYAYDLGRDIAIRPGRLYPALTALLDRGAIHDGWEQAPVGRPARRWYRISQSTTRSEVTP